MKLEKQHLTSKRFLGSAAVLVILLTVGIAYAQGAEVTDEPRVNWVSHTEYWRNDSASTIVRLTDYQGDPYPVSECNVTILYPNKSEFVTDAPMQQSNIPGNWYRTDSLQGQPLGNYEQQVTCDVGEQTISTSNSFHLNPALEKISEVSNATAAIQTNLTNVSAEFSAQLADTNESIQDRIDVLDTNVTTLVDDVNESLSSDLSSTEQNLLNNLSEARMNITATMESTGQEIQTDLSAVNSSLSSMLSSTRDNLSAQLNRTLANLTAQLTTIQNETEWLTQNAMNEEDREDIMQRFNAVDGNLSQALNYCGPATNDTELCQELNNVSNAIDTYNEEQNEYLTSINETTLNTWQLLSGQIRTNINNILATVNLIETRTEAINETTQEILDEMQDDVNARIIA